MLKLKNFGMVLSAIAFSAFSLGQAFAEHPQNKPQENAAQSLPLKGKKILFILSSKSKLEGQSPRRAGLWAQSLAAPYLILTGEGAKITMASVQGGRPPVDPRSENSDFATSYTKKFRKDETAQEAFSHTLRLADVKPENFDAICYTSSYGMFFDLVNDADSQRLLTSFARAKKPIALTSQGPVVLKYVTDIHGSPLVRGRVVTAFRNSEEAGSKLSLDHSIFPVVVLKTMDHGRTYRTAELPEDQFLKKLKLVGTVPFLTETLLKAQGAIYKSQPNWQAFVVEDLTSDGGILLTAQNPDSVELWTKALSDILRDPKKAQKNIAASGSVEMTGDN